MTILDTLRAQREEILRIADKHGARNVRVFGSVIHGDERPDSDIDLLVDVAPEHSPFFPAGFIADLEELFRRDIDVVTAQGLHWYIRDRVLAEAVPL